MSTTHPYHKIFVSLDGSDGQQVVLKKAIEVARNNQAELYIGHVIDVSNLDTAGHLVPDLLSTYEHNFKDSISGMVSTIKNDPDITKVEILVRAGRIRETLQDEILENLNPDLVICGARGLSSIKYAILGSISTFLVRNTKCDTLIVK